MNWFLFSRIKRWAWVFLLLSLFAPLHAIAEPSRTAPAPAHRTAPERIWSGLVFATDEAHPAATPAALAPFEQRLRTAFGYNQLQLLSEHREPMDEVSERWLLPGKGFCVSVRTRRGPTGDYLLTLQVFQEKRLLVETRAQLRKQSPLLVRGPMYDTGQLILVLVVE